MVLTQRHEDARICVPLPAPENPLRRLARLQDEAGRNLVLAQYLSRAPTACVALMLTGAGAILWTALAGGGSLKADFCWAALLLFGIGAMTRNHIRGFARSLRRVPLEEAASDLTVLLLYMGTVWGMGAFLVMPGAPAPALAVLFAALPGFCVMKIMKHPQGLLAFLAPAGLIPAAAALLGAWPFDIWVAAVILAATIAMLGFSWLPRPRPAALQAAFS